MKFTFAPESKPLEGYTIKRAIQRGGFGEVYYALSDAGKEVALKLVQQNMEIELRGVSQCLNLKHPNLVTIFDIRTDDDGDHWIVMEYVSGHGLDRVLADHPQGLPLEDVCRWLDEIAAGIGYLHDRGIVHRDLKPANVYSENGMVKIGDVGLSKFISPSRRSAHTQSVGTVYYMAPEVAHGRYGREVDVYSLAVILFEMLTGRVPFDGETTGEILMKHLSEQPDLGPIPERIRPVLARALEKDPQKRTPSVKQLQREFHEAVTGSRSAIAGSEPVTADTKYPHRDTSRRTGDDPVHGRHSPAGHSPAGQRRSGQRAPVNGHRRHGHDHRHAGTAPIPWHAEPGAWWRTGAVVVILLAVIAPRFLVGTIGTVTKMCIFGALVYAVYWLFVFASRAAHDIFGTRHPASHRKSPPRHDNSQQTDERHGRTHNAAGNQRPVYASLGESAQAAPAKHRHRSNKKTRRQLSLKQRITELSGSMASATMCTALLTFGLHLFGFFDGQLTSAGLFGFTALLATWAVMLPSKLWEGRRIDGLQRRMLMLVLGGLVGTAGWWLDQSLMVDYSPHAVTMTEGPFRTIGSQPLHDAALQPTWAAYAAFFGSIFLLRRWWWHADSYRPKRLRVTSLMLTALIAYVMSAFWGFPMVWAVTWAVAISSVVQVSSVWLPLEERGQNAEGAPQI